MMDPNLSPRPKQRGRDAPMCRCSHRRPCSSYLSLALLVWFALLSSPASRAWLLPASSPDHGQRAGSPSLRRSRSPTRKGPPFRRRSRWAPRGSASQDVPLSASAPVVEGQRSQVAQDTQPRLADVAWPVQMAVGGDLGERFPDADERSSLPVRGCNAEGRDQQGFEGPEKTLEIEFDPNIGHEDGLRAIRREQWDAILEQAQCQILHHRGNECFDSYVLSESSLFVYKSKLVLKTCGTTTLLRCLPLLTVVTKNYGLSLEWIGYSRKDFTFPSDQIYPHTSFAQEVDFLQTMFTGSAYVHGPLNSDHWYTYVADDCRRPTSATADRTLNLMMYDLEPEVAQNFYSSEDIRTAEDVSLRSGIGAVLPKAALQGHLFEPCGYSMNALEGRAYYTVHVTPEPDFSYASFETNVRLPDYDDLVRRVLEVFRPRKFTMTLFAEKTGMENIKQNPFDYTDITCRPTRASRTQAHYMRTLKTVTNFSGDYSSQMGNWVRDSVPESLESATTQTPALTKLQA